MNTDHNVNVFIGGRLVAAYVATKPLKGDVVGQHGNALLICCSTITDEMIVVSRPTMEGGIREIYQAHEAHEAHEVDLSWAFADDVLEGMPLAAYLCSRVTGNPVQGYLPITIRNIVPDKFSCPREYSSWAAALFGRA